MSPHGRAERDVHAYCAIADQRVAHQVLPDDLVKELPRLDAPVVLLTRLASIGQSKEQ